MSDDPWSDEVRERFVAAYRAATGCSKHEARRIWDRLKPRWGLKRTIVWWAFRDWIGWQAPLIACGSIAMAWVITYIIGVPGVMTYALQTAAFAVGCSFSGFLLGTLAYLIWNRKSLK